MPEESKIEWTDSTWSPWRGCTKVSPGCANCYAEVLSRRNPKVLGQWGKGKPRVRNADWNAPLRWDRKAAKEGKRFRVFPSLCDWLDDEVPIEWLADFLQLIRQTPNLDWQLLTKRPENMHDRAFVAALHFCAQSREYADTANWIADWRPAWCEGGEEPPSNVWLGVSVEDQKRADERIPLLLDTPAKVRFLSCEPLLERIDLLSPAFNGAESYSRMGGLHWVIVGGESGPHARECAAEWIWDIVLQCRTAKAHCFVKQLGAFPVVENPNAMEWPDGTRFLENPACTTKSLAKLRDRKGGDMFEWPKELWVRQFPEVKP